MEIWKVFQELTDAFEELLCMPSDASEESISLLEHLGNPVRAWKMERVVPKARFMQYQELSNAHQDILKEATASTTTSVSTVRMATFLIPFAQHLPQVEACECPPCEYEARLVKSDTPGEHEDPSFTCCIHILAISDWKTYRL